MVTIVTSKNKNQRDFTHPSKDIFFWDTVCFKKVKIKISEQSKCKDQQMIRESLPPSQSES